MSATADRRAQLRDQIIHVGSGAIRGAADDVTASGWRRIAVLASRSAADAGLLELARQAIPSGAKVVLEHVGVSPHSPAEETEHLAETMTGLDPDAMLCVGGGKVSDAAKGVSILLASGGHLVDHCTTFVPPADYRAPAGVTARLPIIAVPTTLSGAELTPGGGVRTPAGEKRAFWAKDSAARLVAYDVEVLRRTPRHILGGTGMNALAHCVEGMYSRTSSPYSDALAQAAARDLMSGLRQLAAGARADEVFFQLGSAAALAGLVIGTARTGLHHAMCHVLGARLGLAHGDANGVMLAHVLRYNTDRASRPLTRLAEAVDRRLASPEQLADSIQALVAELGNACRLRDLGVTSADLPMLAAAVRHERGLYFNPEPVPSEADVLGILKRAW